MNRKMKAIFAIALCAFFLVSAFGAMAPVAAKEGSRTAVKKTVMGELFTATWCQYCPTATNSLSTIVNDTNYYPDRFTILEWHYSDTYAITAGGPRQTMFGVTGYPTTVFDGDSAGKIVGGQTAAVYKSAIDGKAATTGVNITISNVTLASNLLSADVIFEKVDTLAAGTFNARVFLVEDLKTTFSNSGGVGYMRHTVRDDVYNQSMDLTDGMQHKVSLTGISVPASYDKYAVGLVAAYQSYAPADKSIVQSRIWEFHNYPVPITAIAGAKDFSMNEDVIDEHIDVTTVFGADPEAQTVTYKLKSKATASHLTLSMNGTKVKVVPEANWFGSESFTIEADDGYAKNAQSIYDVAVTITSVNDAPVVITTIADVKMKEGSSKTINLMDSGKEVFSDIENDTLTFTATDLETTPHMNVTVLKGANPAVKIDIPDGSAGKDTIQVTANDGTESTSLTFKVEITDVNHNPTVKAKMGTVTFDEDTVYTTINLNNVFTDFDGDKLTYDFWGSTKITVTVNTTGEVTLSPAKDWSGTEVITFRATDTGALNAVDELTATVTPVNDAPVIKKEMDRIELDEDETMTIDDPLSTFFSDVETSSDMLTYEVDGPKDLTLTLDDELKLIIEPEPNYFGEGKITITCTDGEKSVEMEVSFTVVSVNDPVVIDTANVKPVTTTPSIDEGKDLTFEVPAVDGDGDAPLKFIWSVDGDVQEGATEKTFTFTPDKTMGGEKVKVSVKVSDGAGSEVTYDWTVTVKDINNKPTLTLVSPEAGKEYPAGPVSLAATAADIDGDTLTYSWFVDNTPVGTTANLTTDIQTGGSHTIKVKVSDGKLEDTKEVTITVKASGGGGGGKSSGAPGFELVGLIAAIGVAAVVVMRRRE